jgi:uncharacterized protein
LKKEVYMKERYIFHLAFAVADLEAAKHFYVDLLGAQIGRENNEWLDILLWGHQITLHCRPLDVVSLDEQGKRHFGVVLPWAEWQNMAESLQSQGYEFLSKPTVLLAGTHEEQAKFYLKDPSNNIIEIKSYRNFAQTLRQGTMAYSYAEA